MNFCSAARITITREQSIKLQKLLHEKPAGHRKFTDFEVRRNASRLKIPAVKIRYWLKQRNAYVDEGAAETRSLSIVVPKSRVLSVVVPKSQDDEVSVIGVKSHSRQSKLLNEISFEKKVQLLKKTMTTMNVSTRYTRELSRELQIDENRIYNWLKHKVHRNLNMKKSLTADELSALHRKFAEYDYLDDDTALVLSDRFNVPIAVIKKALQQHKPSTTPKNVPKPVVHIRKLPIVALTSVTPSKGIRSSPKMKPVGDGGSSKKNPSFKTVDQKNLLFEAFRQSPTLTKNDTVTELVNATGLQPQQITKWLSEFRTKWAHNNESGLKKALTRGLTQSQLVEMEKAYRGDRFLTHAQLAELAKTVNLTVKALQAWFSNRRVYEIRSCDKDLVNIGPKTAAARKEASQPLQQQPQPQQVIAQPANSGDADNAEFFESLNKEQKALLKAGCKSYNVSYSRLAQTIGVPAEKIKQYIVGYRVRHSIFRQNNRSIPERVHKSLLNHMLKYGKISSKTSVALAKRLKIRPEQVRNWSRTYASRILEHNRPAQRPAIAAAPQPAPVAPAVTTQQPVVELYEDTKPAASSAAAGPKYSAKKRLVGSKYVVPSSAKNVLLEEFLKSPQAAANKSKELAKMVGITPMQANNWFYNFGKRLNEQNKSEVVACVINNPAISDQQRARLEAEYRNCRYLEVPEMEALTAEIGLKRKQIENWFINARYYEVLTGQCPGGSGGTKTASKSATTPKSFYESLNSQQRACLKDELNSYPLDDQRLYDLANELQVSSNELKNWFEKASRSKTRSRSLPNPALPLNLTAKALETLTKEFEIDPILPEARAGALAKRTKVTKDRIKAWFANRQEEMHKFEENEQADERKLVKHKIPPIRITIPKYVAANGDADFDSSSKKSYFQQNRLFEEFKMDPTLTNERLIKISRDTNLDGKQISAWFDWIKAKLASIPRDSLLEENRNSNLTARQIAILGEEYAKNRYVDRTVREALSRSLGVSKNVVKTWFANKRYSEILCQDGSVDSDPLSPQDGDFDDDDEDEARQTETPIDYGWDQEETVFVDDDAEVEHKLDVKRPVEVDPLLDYSFEDETNNEDVKTNISYNFQLSPNSAFTDNLTSLPYQPRNRLFTRLGKDLEPLEGDVEKLFWFASKTPNKTDARFDQDIDDEKNRVLESEFGKNPWPELERISQLSTQLLISEPKIHWWFIKKRCFLTKTILNIPSPKPKPKPKSAPKNVLIDLTVDESDSQSPKCGEFEFVTLDETTPVKEEEEEPLTEEDDDLEIGDPFENDVREEQSLINEEPSQDPIVTNAMEVQTPFVEPSVDPIDTNTVEEQSLDPIDTNAMEVESPFNEQSVDPIDTNTVEEQSSVSEQSSQDTINTNTTVEQSSINDHTQDPLITDDTVTNATTISPTNSSASATIKKKPKKIPLTTHQRAVLKQEFKLNKIIPNSQARLLAQDLGLTVGRIEAWFENMRIKRKKPNPSETSTSVKNLSAEIEAGLEEEYLKSVNLSNKRAKMIAIKLNTRKRIVVKWFVERAKRIDQ